MLTQTHVPILAHSPGSMKTLDQLDFFHTVKLDYLSAEDKQKRLDAMWRVALLHFINVDLPHLLSPQDMATLEQMTQDEHKLDLDAVQKFLREKVNNFDDLISKNLGSIKKQLILHHYEQERKLLELEQAHKGIDHLEQILAIERLLQAVELDDWDTVEATVPHTFSSH